MALGIPVDQIIENKFGPYLYPRFTPPPMEFLGLAQA